MKNVNTLEEANVILFGEKHTCLEHRIKICWLLNKLAQDGDSLNIEGAGPDDQLTPEIFEAAYHYPIYPQMKITGWDSLEALKRTLDFFEKAAEFTEWLEGLLEIHDTMTDEDKVKTIQKANFFFPKDEIEDELNEMKKNHFDFYFPEGEKILILPRVIKDAYLMSLHAETTKGEELDVLFLLILGGINDYFYLWGLVQLLGLNFLDRNSSLANQVSAINISNQKEALYGIAGKSHLQRKENLGVKKAFETVENALRRQKYVILFPTKSRENIEHVETKYVDTALKSPPDKQVCTRIDENNQKHLALTEQIKSKIKLIPREVVFKILSTPLSDKERSEHLRNT